MKENPAETKKLFYKGIFKILLAVFLFIFLMILSDLFVGKFGGFPSMFLSIASFFAFVTCVFQGFSDLIKRSLLKKKAQDSIDLIKSEPDNKLNSLKITTAILSTLISLMVITVFPFGSLSFSLGKEVQFILTAIAGPVSYFLWREKRGVGRFFVIHFISTIVLGRVFELLVLVLGI